MRTCRSTSESPHALTKCLAYHLLIWHSAMTEKDVICCCLFEGKGVSQNKVMSATRASCFTWTIKQIIHVLVKSQIENIQTLGLIVLDDVASEKNSWKPTNNFTNESFLRAVLLVSSEQNELLFIQHFHNCCSRGQHNGGLLYRAIDHKLWHEDAPVTT